MKSILRATLMLLVRRDRGRDSFERKAIRTPAQMFRLLYFMKFMILKIFPQRKLAR